MMKSLLIVTPFFRPNLGGVETALTEVTRALSEAGVQTNVLTFQPLITQGVKGESFEDNGNIKIWRYQWFGKDLFHKLLKYPVLEFLYLSVPLFFLTLFFLLKNQKKLNIGTVHAAGLNAAFACVLVKKLLGFKLVIATHAIYNFQKGALFSNVVKWICDNVDQVLSVGEASRQELIRIEVSPEKVANHPVWINQTIFDRMSKDEAKKSLDLQGKFVFGFISRLNEIKGVKLVLEAAKAFEHNENIKFVFAGGGDLEEEVLKASKETKNVIYYGRINNYDLQRYYNALDIFFSLALYEEGFTRAAVEALCCGIPVLASNKGCLPEIVENNKSGWLIEPSLENLVAKISEVVDNQKNLTTYSDYAYKSGRERFNEHTQVNKMIDFHFLK